MNPMTEAAPAAPSPSYRLGRSAKLMIRITPSTHTALKQYSRESGRSINDLLVPRINRFVREIETNRKAQKTGFEG